MVMELTPAHRTSDPKTSYLSDKEITRSGKRQRDIDRAVKAVERYPNRTCRELARDSGLEYDGLHKRLPESMLLEKGDKRKCTVTGKMACTWRVK